MTVQTKIGLREIESAGEFNRSAKDGRWPMLCDHTCTFTYAKHGELYALWHDLAGPGGVPYRRDFSPRRLQPYMKSIVIYERIAGEDGRTRYRVRLMGGNITPVLGELTGRYLDEAVSDKYRPRWCAMIDASLAAGAPLRMLSRSDSFDKAYLIGEYFCAPMRADDGATNLVLAAGHYEGTRSWTELAAKECERLGLEPMGIV